MGLVDDIMARLDRAVVYLDQDGADYMYLWRCTGCAATLPFDGDYEIVAPFPHAHGCLGRMVPVLVAAEAQDASETAPCRFCNGTGRLDVERCAEIVNGRPCKHPARTDPSYFEMFPEREDLRPYCGFHGNARGRALDRAADAPDV